MSKPQQSLKSHARFDPAYHGILLSTIVINLIVSVVYAVLHLSFWSVWYIVLSLVAFVALLRLRSYPLKVQDRLIRLEERLRLQALAPTEWHAQIYRLTEDQLVGLRFAADEEAVELAKQALEHSLSRKQIKERIKSWRADEFRV